MKASRIALGVLALVGLIVLTRTSAFKEYLASILTWTQSLGPWAAVLIGALYIPACLFFVPGSLLTLCAGAISGLVVGTVAVSIGSTLGAGAAFLAGRTLARDWIAGKVAGNPRFKAVD